MSYQNLIFLNASIPKTNYDKKEEDKPDPNKPIDFSAFVAKHGGSNG